MLLLFLKKLFFRLLFYKWLIILFKVKDCLVVFGRLKYLILDKLGIKVDYIFVFNCCKIIYLKFFILLYIF